MISKWWSIEYSYTLYEEDWGIPELRIIKAGSVFDIHAKMKHATTYITDKGGSGARIFIYERLDTGAFNTIDVQTFLQLKAHPRILNNPSKKITSDLDNEF